MGQLASIFWIIVFLSACQSGGPTERPASDTGYYRPSQQLPQLFHQVQMQRVFEDSKTFVDSRALRAPREIEAAFERTSDRSPAALRSFVEQHFHPPPQQPAQPFQTDTQLGMTEHLREHWQYLTRPADPAQRWSTLIPLPHAYVVPGGRFREIYYWDSYFTMLGLMVSDEQDLVYSMLKNFAWLTQTVGHIPNGNRTYYLSRSQPPFFAAMVALYAQDQGEQAALEFLPALETEHQFWMRGTATLAPGKARQRVVRMPDGSILNRYYDQSANPRPESYLEDVQTVQAVAEPDRRQTYRDLRAAAESGWDFSSRWFADASTLTTIQTTQIVPVDLNSLLYHLELTISRLYRVQADPSKAAHYATLAQNRKTAMHKWLWDEKQGYFRDYNWRRSRGTEVRSLAMVYPLYFNLANDDQADAVAQQLQDAFLYNGGLVTTLNDTGEQWDYPNGWPPLQWLAAQGLRQYGHHALSRQIAERWLALNRKVFRQTGKMMEKYNVVDTSLLAGGGEYPLQDGFGWTNGVALKLMDTFEGGVHHPRPTRRR